MLNPIFYEMLWKLILKFFGLDGWTNSAARLHCVSAKVWKCRLWTRRAGCRRRAKRIKRGNPIRFAPMISEKSFTAF